MNDQLAKQLTNLPTDPGIYRYYDQQGQLLYVGKAKNLKNRVKSYFADKHTSPKTKALVSQIDRLETIIVASEIDALILEANLIKQHQPPYNIILKDDKSHVYVKITTYQEYPTISTCRQTDLPLDTKATYFGPYPSGRVVRQTLRYLRKVFPYLAHRPPVPQGRRRTGQSFFYYNLNLGQVNKDEVWDKKEYRRQVFQLVHFFEGKRLGLMEEIQKDMQAQAKQLNFEKAAELKQQLDNLIYLANQSIAPDDYLQNPELMADRRQQGLEELSQSLSPYFNNLQPPTSEVLSPLHRIECYDISNTMGEYSVGSMVVFIEGEAAKSNYRKFRIKQENVPNDVAMIKEVLTRRFKRLKVTSSDERRATGDKNEPKTPASRIQDSLRSNDISFSDSPNLIIIDGGKGQLSGAIEVMGQLGLNIPVAGMTKREEELMLKTGSGRQDTNGSGLNSSPVARRSSHELGSPKRSGAHGAIAKSDTDLETQTITQAEYTTIRLARGSQALFMIQRLRDEAHRFAITYHKNLRKKAFLPGKQKPSQK